MNNNFLSTTKVLQVFFLLILLVYIPGLLVPLMDNDSAHHAGIGLHMYLTGNYAFLMDLDQPYLDKPHLLFWLSALSYKTFGVNTFAFKFPSFLFTVLCVYSTYRLGSLLYNKNAGRLAALILASSCAFVLANNDVRMEAILTGSMTFAIWQLCAYIARPSIPHLMLAALGLALGFSTKGMIGVVIPAVAIFLHLLYHRNWKMLFHWKWLLLVFFFALFISPVVYCYYLQYDLHPDTAVRGMKNISGVKFILWNQNIERMKGEGHTQKHKAFFFFFHTFLWAFLPWSLAAVVAVASRIRTVIRSGFSQIRTFDFLTLGAIVFFMLFFSFSSFKLPHYLNCLFPLFAILLGGYLVEKDSRNKNIRLLWILQLISVILAILAALALNLWAFPVSNMAVIILLLVIAAMCIGSIFLKTTLFNKMLAFTFSGSLLIFASLNLNFYPQLLKYQAGNELAFKTQNLPINPREVYLFMPGDYSFSYDFYTAYQHPEVTREAVGNLLKGKKSVWLFTSAEGKSYLENHHFPITRVFENKDYRISILTPKFLNPATREKVLTTTYLIKLF